MSTGLIIALIVVAIVVVALLVVSQPSGEGPSRRDAPRGGRRASRARLAWRARVRTIARPRPRSARRERAARRRRPRSRPPSPPTSARRPRRATPRPTGSTPTSTRTRRLARTTRPTSTGGAPMIIGGIIAVCVLLLVLAFVFPRLSRHPERGVNKTLGVGQQRRRPAARLPRPLGAEAVRQVAPGDEQERIGRPQGPRQAARLGLSAVASGGGGIRTPGPVARTLVFKTSAFDHSATPPGAAEYGRRMPASHADTIRDFYAAFARKDGDAMAAAYAPDVHFRDPAFGDLHGEEPGAMWRMLTGRSEDLEIELVEHDDVERSLAGALHVQHRPPRGQRRARQLQVRRRGQDHRAHRRVRLLRLGAPGARPGRPALGWTPIIKGGVRKKASAQLDEFMKR